MKQEGNTGLYGGGIDIQITVANTVDATLSGTPLVATEGSRRHRRDPVEVGVVVRPTNTYLSAEGALRRGELRLWRRGCRCDRQQHGRQPASPPVITGARTSRRSATSTCSLNSVVDIDNMDTPGISGSFGAGVTTNACARRRAATPSRPASTTPT